MTSFFNNNQVLAVELIPVDAIQFVVGAQLYPLSQVFHSKSIIDKKLMTIAYKDGNTYKSLSDDTIVNTYDALIDKSIPSIRLILDADDISFKSTPEKSVSGVLYTNKLEYSVPRIDATQMNEFERQLQDIKQGGYHMLIQLSSCGKAYTIVLCPEIHAYSASSQENITSTNISINIKNLTAHQYLR